jgi:hypothetical protein
MATLAKALAVSLTAALVPALLITSPATATPSCVAQSVHDEHELTGTAWGHDVVALLASHPELLAGFGFDSFGDLASYSARQSHANCPADL